MGMKKERLEAQMKQEAIAGELERTRLVADTELAKAGIEDRSARYRTDTLADVERSKIPVAQPGGETAYNFGSGSMGKPTGEVVEAIRGANRTYAGFTKDKTGTYHGMEYATPWGAQSLKGSTQMADEAKNAFELSKIDNELKAQKEILGITKPGGGESTDDKVASAMFPGGGVYTPAANYKPTESYKPTEYITKNALRRTMPGIEDESTNEARPMSFSKLGSDINSGLFNLLDPAGIKKKKQLGQLSAAYPIY